MIELKPCPFCGETPTREISCRLTEGFKNIYVLSVRCQTCGTTKNISAEVNYETTDTFKYIICKMRDVEDLWNRRSKNE